MPSMAPGTKILQVQLEIGKVEALDSIQHRTYVPRSTLIRMAIDRFLDDVAQGKVAMGLAASGPVAPGAAGQQATFAVVQDPRTLAPPPPPAPGLPFDPAKQG